MHTTILNRDFKLPDDGWYAIETPGEHLNKTAGVVQVIDRESVESIVNRFQADAKEPGFPGLLVDFDHFSLDTDKPSAAAGWVTAMRNREGVPEAQIRWTSQGQPRVAGGDYRFFSTVYNAEDQADAGTRLVNGRTFKAVRPLRLSRVALTNDPNNKGGKPISNRQGDPDAVNHQPDTATMKNVNKELGLAEDAQEASAVGEIQKIRNRAAAAEVERDALKKERDELLTAQVESDLELHKGVIKNRDAVKAQLLANRKGTLELLSSLHAPAAAATEKPAPITNRAGAKTPDDASKKDAQNQESVAARIMNRAHQLVKEKSTNRRPYSFPAAFNEAAAEIQGKDAK